MECTVVTSAEEGGYVFGAVCLSVCPSDYSQTCERILTNFFGGVGHGSRTKWYNFGGDPDHASDPGVQSLKSGSSGSAEVCGLWAYLVGTLNTHYHDVYAMSVTMSYVLCNHESLLIYFLYVCHGRIWRGGGQGSWTPGLPPYRSLPPNCSYFISC